MLTIRRSSLTFLKNLVMEWYPPPHLHRHRDLDVSSSGTSLSILVFRTSSPDSSACSWMFEMKLGISAFLGSAFRSSRCSSCSFFSSSR